VSVQPTPIVVEAAFSVVVGDTHPYVAIPKAGAYVLTFSAPGCGGPLFFTLVPFQRGHRMTLSPDATGGSGKLRLDISPGTYRLDLSPLGPGSPGPDTFGDFIPVCRWSGTLGQRPRTVSTRFVQGN